MGMKALALPLLAAALAAGPSAVFAAGGLADARGAADNPARFDGALVRPESPAVVVGASTDHRTQEQIAKDEQVKSDARQSAAVKANGPDAEIVPPKPNPWLAGNHIRAGVKGGLIGMLVGSLFGLAGLGIGALVGAALAYGLSRFT